MLIEIKVLSLLKSRWNILFLLVLCLSWESMATTVRSKDSLIIFVKDSHKKPMSGVKISIPGNPAVYSGKSGNVSFIPTHKLIMPFEVTAELPGYEMDEFVYYEDENEIQVFIKKSASLYHDYLISLKTSSGYPLKNFTVQYGKNKAVTDPKGNLSVRDKTFNSAQLFIEGYTIQKIIPVENGSSYIVVVATTTSRDGNTLPLSTPGSSISGVASVKDTVIVRMEEKIYQEYRDEFQNISTEIYEERQRLIAANTKIKDEIIRITEKLKNEKNLSSEQREKLTQYLDRLEHELSENSLAFRRAEEKTQALINRLKMMLLQKDSLNQMNLSRLKIEETKRIQAEKKNKRTLIVFTVIIVSLVLLALSFYSIARKMRKQRSELLKSKNDLDQNLVEIKRQKERIEAQNEQLDLFAYKVSHDIKGPLRSISGLSDIGLKTNSDPQSIELFGHIKKSAIRLDQLVADLLTLSRDANAELTSSSIPVREMLEEIIPTLNRLDNYSQIKIDIMIDKNALVQSDKNLLHSILQNLVENAIKYCDLQKSERFLKITMDSGDQYTKIIFTDNGIGIDEEHHDKIFNMFYRSTTASAGSGLGLYIVKQNAKRLNGDIILTSKPRQGSVFTLVLPK